MVGRRRHGITAVVGGNHKQIILAKTCHNLRELLVKIRKRLGISVHIIAVTINHVRIHQIGETQTVEIFMRCLNGFFNTLGVT